MEQLLQVWLKSKKMHNPNGILGFPEVMLPGGGSKYAKHIKTTNRGQKNDLMELHSGMRGKVDIVNENYSECFAELKQAISGYLHNYFTVSIPSI